MSFVAYAQTVNIYLGTFALGLLVSSVGPTLMDLAEVYDTSTENVSHIFTSRAVGLLIGSVAGGKLYALCNGQLLMMLSVVGMGLTTFATPSSPNLTFLHGISAIGGCSLAVFEIGASVWLVRLWKENASWHLQIYQLAFALGAVVAPFIAEPFLSQHQSNVGNFTGNDSLLVEATNMTLPGESQVTVPYAIFGACSVVTAASMIVASVFDSTDIAAESNENELSFSSQKKNSRFELWIIFLLGSYVFFDVCIEACFSGMISTFAVHCDLHFTKGSASYLTGAFWMAFTLGRVIAIACALWVSLNKLLVSCHFILASAATALFLFGEANAFCLWAATAALGLGMSALYGSSFAWTVRYVRLRHEHVGFMMIMTCFASMSPSFLLGSRIETEPMSLMHWTAVLVAAFTANLVIMFWSVRNRSQLGSTDAKVVNYKATNTAELSN